VHGAQIVIESSASRLENVAGLNRNIGRDSEISVALRTSSKSLVAKAKQLGRIRTVSTKPASFS
jgi:hypothetical protein